MRLFVLFENGRPLELPASDAETVHHLMDHDGGVDSVFAFASTNRPYVAAMRLALAELLDKDDGWLATVTIEAFKHEDDDSVN